MSLSKRERVDAVLKGETPDRAPVSAWRHILAAEGDPGELAHASLQQFRQYDWDWMKFNPRATYYAEAWGCRYDFSRYTGVYPRLLSSPVRSSADFDKIDGFDPLAGVFGEHARALQIIKAGIDGAHCIQTLFTPLSVLYFLTWQPEEELLGLKERELLRVQKLRRYLAENPVGAHQALQNIAAVLGKFAAAAVENGASGLFFAITRLARAGALTPQEYAEFGKSYDLQVLQVVKEAPFNLLHICGAGAYLDSVLDYPVHVLNWASIGQGNPSLAETFPRTGKVLAGGLDEDGVLLSGTPEQVREEALSALQQGAGKRFMLTPGCAYSEAVPDANLFALRHAAGA